MWVQYMRVRNVDYTWVRGMRARCGVVRGARSQGQGVGVSHKGSGMWIKAANSRLPWSIYVNAYLLAN